MIKEKIDTIYALLGCNNADIARMLNCSPSTISKLHSGSRKLSPGSKSVLRFAEGVYGFAESVHALDNLSLLCHAKGRERELLLPALTDFLFTEDENVPEIVPFPEQTKEGRRKINLLRFGKKLSQCMDLLELTNVRLSRKLNVDASLISRYRKGLRIPRFPLSELLAHTLYEQAQKLELLDSLAVLCEISEGELDVESFSAWLWDDKDEQSFNIDNLLNVLDSHQQNTPPPFPGNLDFITPELLESGKTIYWGKEGIREAVLRFLAEALQEESDLYLYSDQDMEWMVGDNGFQMKWYALMSACVAAGKKIHIIHNIDRGGEEMIAAIKSWLSLYISGRIDPWVCTLRKNFRFYRTIFLQHGKSCILASGFRGNEEEGWYDYITDSKRLDSIAAEYDMLLSNSMPLIRISGEAPAVLIQATASVPLRQLASFPSLATMPKELFETILHRSPVCGTTQMEQIRQTYTLQKEMLKACLENGAFHEMLTLPTKELLAAGKVPVNIHGIRMNYTPEEFATHIRAIYRLADTCGNYRLTILPQLHYKNLGILETKNQVLVNSPANHDASFIFSEPQMMHAFRHYLDTLENQYQCGTSQIKQQLEAYF